MLVKSALALLSAGRRKRLRRWHEPRYIDLEHTQTPKRKLRWSCFQDRPSASRRLSGGNIGELPRRNSVIVAQPMSWGLISCHPLPRLRTTPQTRRPNTNQPIQHVTNLRTVERVRGRRSRGCCAVPIFTKQTPRMEGLKPGF